MTGWPPGGATYQEVRAAAGFAYGAVGADIHVFGDSTPVYLLYVHAPGPLPADGSVSLRDQPSRMLDARSEVVPFTGREAQLAELRGWRDAPGELAVRWLHGPGGSGKSRLAARFAAECADAGWLVVDAVHGTDGCPPAPGSQDLRTEGRPGVLVLVDYADRWPHAHLSWLFHNMLLRGRPPARVLLLGRSVAPWPGLRAQLNRQRRSAGVSDQVLGPLSAELGAQDERRLMFEAARNGFAAHFEGLGPLPAPGDLSGPDFGLVLAVHMAALVAVDAQARGRTAPEDLTGMTAYLLDREHLAWCTGTARGADASTEQEQGRVMGRAVFTAVLTGPMPRERALPLLDRLMFEDPAGVVSAHAAGYPAPRASDGRVLWPLLPDRLAEDLLALALPGSPVSGYPTDLWTATATRLVLERDGGGAPPWTPRALTFLTAAAERWPHVGQRVLFPLLRRDPALAVRAGSAVLAALADLPTVDPRVLEAIEPELPAGDIRVTAGAGELVARLAAGRLERASGPLEQGRARLQWGKALVQAGRRSEALVHLEEAVRLTERAVHCDPALRVEHAQAVLCLATSFASEAAPEWTMAWARRAIGLLRAPCRGADESERLGTLVRAHTLLATALAATDDLRAAHAAAAEAACAAHELGERDPWSAISSWSSQNDLIRLQSLLLAAEGQPDRAAEFSAMAVANARQWARLSPARHGAVLARHLAEHSERLWDAGMRQEAAASLREAVHLLRQIARVRPEDRESLAGRLERTADMLTALGRSEEAGQLLEETAALRRALAADAAARGDRAAATAHEDAVARALRRLRRQHATSRERGGGRNGSVVRGRRLVREGQREKVWELIRSQPVAGAVRLAHRLPRRAWDPADPATCDATGDRELAELLLSWQPRAAARAVRDASRDAVWVPPWPGAPGGTEVSFAVAGEACLSRETDDPARPVPDDGRVRTTRIEVWDLDTRTLRWWVPHRRLPADPPRCLGRDAVLAVRPRSRPGDVRGAGVGLDLVLYRPEGERVLACDVPLSGARIAPTAYGFVVLSATACHALVGTAAGTVARAQCDPESFGLSRCDVVAADPTGTRVAFGCASRLVITDDRLEKVVVAGRRPLPAALGPVREAVFLSPDELVVAGPRGRWGRFEVESGELVPTVLSGDGPDGRGLFALPAHGAVGGSGRKGRTVCHDAVTLARMALPGPLSSAAGGRPCRMTASADGRYVVHHAAVRRRRRGASDGSTVVVHDLGHPAALLTRPVSSLSPAEAAALAGHSAGPAGTRELMRLAATLGRARPNRYGQDG